MSKLKFVKDGFKNILKGLGTDKDPRNARTFSKGMLINQQIANDLYVYNWLAAKGVNIPIDDATRKWRSLQIPDADKKKEIEELMKDFDVKGKISLAAKWARVFGGSAIVIIIEGEDPKEPLNIDAIRPGSLKNFIVLDRYNIFPEQINRQILSDNFGNPEYYTVIREGEKIHHSRVIRFLGEKPTVLEAERNNFWGVSIFTRTWDSIADSGTMTQAIGNLVSEASVDVFKIAGLNGMVADGDDNLVVKRLQIMNQMKSVVNGCVLDAEDDYEKKATTFTTLPDIDDRYMQKVAGSFDIPLTRFLGISPSGLNATGDSDMANYDDNVSSIQENDFRPKIDIMDSVIIASAQVEPFEYEFKPLRQLSEKDQAEVNTKNSAVDKTYWEMDVLRTSDILAQIAERKTYTAITAQRVEEELAQEEIDFEEENEEENSISSEEPEELGVEVPEGAE